MSQKPILAIAAATLSLLVVLHEVAYYFAHPNKPGTALLFAALGTANCLLALPASTERRASWNRRGWIRLAVAASALWGILVLGNITIEYFSTNGSDILQGGKRLEFFQWQWTDDHAYVVLMPLLLNVAVALLVPIAVVWALILGVLPVAGWIKKGFEA